MSRADFTAPQTAIATGTGIFDESRRSLMRARWERIRLVALFAMIHVLLGLVGRSIGIAGADDADPSGAVTSLLLGLAGDTFAAVRIALPVAMLLAALPVRWYRSFGLWMLIGALGLGAIGLSIGLAVERARGAVDGAFGELIAAAATSGSLWLEHPFTAVFLVASLCGVLLLGPVRRAANAAFNAEFDEA